ncbi:ADP-ribosylglycohydrolase family protein [Pontibacter sp. HSC-14F20]|uniref:ADP-ribosylglycohydrolase family protein n=1 Tax=Pontibacter sp. HSC-14F20 TaxID=2864136 RepID=UPI001C72F492|nr:ADP-ribosylglycohydrolase family protein [Pontibacter sp. HSC-14F20]MBX0332973.1 ADP-ribosylglycohydrolase family protein [Pontibacter sp. HSC-14F20]
MKSTTQDRGRGALLGLAIGDALGTTLEFTQPGSFEPINDIVGGGPFDLEPGQWTDDTSMALCLADSLLHCKGFDPKDQMERYVRWYRDGYRSSTGHCFDIGNATRTALYQFEQTNNPYSGSTNPQTAGNGSIMRLAPVPLFYHQQPELALQYAAESSRTTHGATTTIDACVYMAGIIVGALEGRTKEELLQPLFTPVENYWENYVLSPEIEVVANGSFKENNPPFIKGSGYVVKSLEAALWAFYISSSFEEGALLAVNLGNDADTTGAVYGQIAGAYYGEQGIPERWRDMVYDKEGIRAVAVGLIDQAKTG